MVVFADNAAMDVLVNDEVNAPELVKALIELDTLLSSSQGRLWMSRYESVYHFAHSLLMMAQRILCLFVSFANDPHVLELHRTNQPLPARELQQMVDAAAVVRMRLNDAIACMLIGDDCRDAPPTFALCNPLGKAANKKHDGSVSGNKRAAEQQSAASNATKSRWPEQQSRSTNDKASQQPTGLVVFTQTTDRDKAPFPRIVVTHPRTQQKTGICGTALFHHLKCRWGRDKCNNLHLETANDFSKLHVEDQKAFGKWWKDTVAAGHKLEWNYCPPCMKSLTDTTRM